MHKQNWSQMTAHEVTRMPGVFTYSAWGSVCNHLASIASNDCFFYVVAFLEFVQVLYELFFYDFVIFLQCGKDFQVRQQCRSVTDSIRQAKFLMRKAANVNNAPTYCAACTNRQHEIDRSGRSLRAKYFCRR